jgi:uncharacterized protein (DUF302 family)
MTTELLVQGKYGFGTGLNLPYEQAVEQVTQALKDEGFGVLTTIDVKETMRQKLGVDFERYVILGACNPQLAHQALTIEHDLGLLLPCNVIVYERAANKSAVMVADPVAMLGVVDSESLQRIAREARERLERVIKKLHDRAAALA